MRISQRGREVTRLEAFSDAVFAFSATLLVVSLDVPHSFAALVADLKGFGAFAVSFGALVLIWTVHNAFFRRYGLQDSATVALNSVLLFVVLFYVYPLKYISRGLIGRFLWGDEVTMGLSTWGELSLLFVLYGLGFTALFACVAGLYAHAWRQREALGLSAVERAEAAHLARHYGLFVLVGLVSIALALGHVGLGWGLPGVVYAALGPLCWAHARWGLRRAPELAEAWGPPAPAATPASAR